MRRLLWILLAVLTVVLFILVAQQDERIWAELTRFDSSGMEAKIMALALIAMIALCCSASDLATCSNPF